MYALFSGRASQGIDIIGFAFDTQTCLLSVHSAGHDHQLVLGLDGRPRENQYVTAMGIPETILASGAWRADDVFEADIRYIETCFHKRITIKFEYDTIEVQVQDNHPGADQFAGGAHDIVGGHL